MRGGANRSESGSAQIDVTVWIPVCAAGLGLAVVGGYLTGLIPSGLAAASFAAVLVAGMLLLLALVETLPLGQRVLVDLDRDDIQEHAAWLLQPGAPLAALVAGLLFGYFFW